MKKLTFVLMCAMLLLGLPHWAFADDQALRQVSKDTDFIVYAPHMPNTEWKLEIPVPYPFHPGGNTISFTRFSYFDMSGDIYLMGIEQHKARGYKTTTSITSIDIKNNTSSTRQEEHEFKFDPSGETVEWNGVQAWFEAWAVGRQNGGFLRWIQDNTYIEMSSYVLTKEQMIEVAKSMKPVEP